MVDHLKLLSDCMKRGLWEPLHPNPVNLRHLCYLKSFAVFIPVGYVLRTM